MKIAAPLVPTLSGLIAALFVFAIVRKFLEPILGTGSPAPAAPKAK